MQTQTPIFVLKRRAKTLSRANNIPHHRALDQIAQTQGYQCWSQLIQHRSRLTSSADLYSQLGRGELLLLGARPGQGKTLKSIELLYTALQEKRQAWFFTLEYNLTDLLDRTRAINIDPETIGDGFHFDNSDEICADYIVKQLKDAPRGSFVVIDFLQLLDQNRRHKPLQQQVSDLKKLAVERAFTIVLISQVDRRFELSQRDFPTLADLRLPNPVDTTLFDKWCFMNNGAYTLQANNHSPD